MARSGQAPVRHPRRFIIFRDSRPLIFLMRAYGVIMVYKSSRVPRIVAPPFSLFGAFDPSRQSFISLYEIRIRVSHIIFDPPYI